jgi:tetratricopeptide (TPR) repeat protein
MKSALILLVLIPLLACNNAAPVANSDRSINVAQQSNEARSVIAHTSENQTPKPAGANSGKWSQSGDPIDTSKFDSAIAAAEKESKAKPSDDAAKKALAEAYFERGVALTDARQYASAIGDYRRALKLDPTHEESKKWIDQIVSIYAMLKKEAPKEGEEPPPLPFKKEA